MPGLHPDWQNIVEWDGAALFNADITANGMVTPVLSVSAWESIFYTFTPAVVDNYRFTIDWYADQAQTILVGEVQIEQDASVTLGIGKYRLQNRGPFVKVKVNAPGGAASHGTLRVFPTNRQYSNPHSQPGETIMWISQVLGAGATLTQGYVVGGPAGEATIWLFGAPASVFYSLEVLSGGAYRQISGIDLPGGAIPAGFSQRGAVSLPQSSWRWSVTNGSAGAGQVNGAIMLGAAVVG